MSDPNKAIAILEQFPTYVFGDPSYGGTVTVPEIIELLKEQDSLIEDARSQGWRDGYDECEREYQENM